MIRGQGRVRIYLGWGADRGLGSTLTASATLYRSSIKEFSYIFHLGYFFCFAYSVALCMKNVSNSVLYCTQTWVYCTQTWVHCTQTWMHARDRVIGFSYMMTHHNHHHHHQTYYTKFNVVFEYCMNIIVLEESPQNVTYLGPIVQLYYSTCIKCRLCMYICTITFQ